MNDDETNLSDLVEQLESRLKWTYRALLMVSIPMGIMVCFIVMAVRFNDRWLMWIFIGASIVSGGVANVSLNQRLRMQAVLSAAKERREVLRKRQFTQPQRGELSQPGATPRVPDTQNS